MDTPLNAVLVWLIELSGGRFMTSSILPQAFLSGIDSDSPRATAWTGSQGLPLTLADAQVVSEEGRLPDAVAESLRQSASDSPKVPSPVSGYHLATRDHPFLDMSTGLAARVEDAKIMAEYMRSDPYPPVHLTLRSDGPTIELPRATDLGLDELRIRHDCRFALIVGGTFGMTGRQVEYFDPATGYHQVELIHKSIPSGGSRHPTECFLEIFRAPSIEPGWYHFSPRLNSLVPTALASPDGEVAAHAAESDADYIVGVHLHSMVERAMFRYRDPRSMRALLVDVGHADGQLAAFAAYCNWAYRSRTRVDLSFGDQSDEVNGRTLPKLASGLLEGWVA